MLNLPRFPLHKVEEPEEEETVLVGVGPLEEAGRTAPGV